MPRSAGFHFSDCARGRGRGRGWGEKRRVGNGKRGKLQDRKLQDLGCRPGGGQSFCVRWGAGGGTFEVLVGRGAQQVPAGDQDFRLRQCSGHRGLCESALPLSLSLNLDSCEPGLRKCLSVCVCMPARPLSACHTTARLFAFCPPVFDVLCVCLCMCVHTRQTQRALALHTCLVHCS